MASLPSRPRVAYHPPAVRLACRNAYVHGEGTLPQIARQHGLPVRTVRGWCSRGKWSEARDRWIDGQVAADANGLPPSQVQAQHGQMPRNSDGDHTRARVARLERQLEGLDAQFLAAMALGKPLAPDAWQKLATAELRIFQQWQVLTGTANPGSRRPSSEKSTRGKRLVLDLGPSDAPTDGRAESPIAPASPSQMPEPPKTAPAEAASQTPGLPATAPARPTERVEKPSVPTAPPAGNDVRKTKVVLDVGRRVFPTPTPGAPPKPRPLTPEEVRARHGSPRPPVPSKPAQSPQ